MSDIIIPKNIHHIWVGPNEIPPQLEFHINSWKKHHQYWNFYLWTDKNMPTLYNHKLYSQARNVAEQADIARYELIYNYGGIFVDIDFECFQSIEPLLNGVTGFGVRSLWKGFISNGIFGAVPKHPAWEALIYNLDTWASKRRKAATNVKTGPYYFTSIMSKRADFKLLDTHLFFPYSRNNLKQKNEHFPDAYAAHHWSKNAWI